MQTDVQRNKLIEELVKALNKDTYIFLNEIQFLSE